MNLTLVDHHAHPFDRSPQPLHLTRLAIDVRDFGEPDSPAPASRPLWRALLNARLAARLGVDEQDLGPARAELAGRDYPGYVSALFRDAGIAELIMDPSWPPGSEQYRDEFAGLSGCRIHLLQRLDPTVDSLLDEDLEFEELVRRYDAVLADAVARGCVGFKSAVAYRTGLRVDPTVDERAARAALEDRAPVRRRAKPLRDWLLRRALAFAADHAVPVQIHTGFGDGDLRLGETDPLHLEDLLRTREARAATVVLLHGSFPYVDQAAWLAAAYRNVHVDLSLVNVFAPTALVDVLQRLTGLAPPERVLLGTDAYALPEAFWFAATELRKAWDRVRRGQLSLGLSRTWVEAAEAAVFGDNARRLYRLVR